MLIIMFVVTNCNLSFCGTFEARFNGTSPIDSDYTLKRSHRNNIELADYFVGHLFKLISESSEGMYLQDSTYGNKKYYVPRSECQCFDFV